MRTIKKERVLLLISKGSEGKGILVAGAISDEMTLRRITDDC